MYTAVLADTRQLRLIKISLLAAIGLCGLLLFATLA